MNLSDKVLSDGDKSLLNKGLKFRVPQREIPIAEFISGVEDAVRHLDQQTADSLRDTTKKLLTNAKPPKSNLSKEEEFSLRKLRKLTKDTVFLPSDKGNVTVVLNRSDYEKKLLETVDSSSFSVLNKDPTVTINNKLIH